MLKAEGFQLSICVNQNAKNTKYRQMSKILFYVKYNASYITEVSNYLQEFYTKAKNVGFG